jgi:hypothetical protein
VALTLLGGLPAWLTGALPLPLAEVLLGALRTSLWLLCVWPASAPARAGQASAQPVAQRLPMTRSGLSAAPAC